MTEQRWQWHDYSKLTNGVFSARGIIIDAAQCPKGDQDIQDWIYAHAYTSVVYVVIPKGLETQRVLLVAYAETAVVIASEELANFFGPKTKLDLLYTTYQQYRAIAKIAAQHVPYLWAKTDQRFRDIADGVLALLYMRVLDALAVSQKNMLRQQHEQVNEYWNLLQASTMRELTLPF